MAGHICADPKVYRQGRCEPEMRKEARDAVQLVQRHPSLRGKGCQVFEGKIAVLVLDDAKLFDSKS